jgi:DDE superfamily endonuclease
MRLLHSVRICLTQTQPPQYQFIPHLLGLLLLLPGHATCRPMRRYRPYHERTCSRWYATDFAWVSRTKAAITTVVPPAHDQALGMEASVVPKSGQQTSGLERFWNGRPRRTATGLEISPLAWLALTDTCAYCRSAEQTPPSPAPAEPATTRMEVSLDQLRRVVQTQDWRGLRSVVTDGAYSTQHFGGGVRALGLHQSGTGRADAHRRSLYPGSKRPGPGRQKTYDGTGLLSALSRVERLETADEHLVLYHHVVNHVQVKRNLQVVVVVHTQRPRSAGLFSTDVDRAALRLSHYYKARFQIACLFRDAKPLRGLRDCQARFQAPLHFHFHASLSAVTFAKLEARQQHGHRDHAFSLASRKRRAFNQHLIDRMCAH